MYNKKNIILLIIGFFVLFFYYFLSAPYGNKNTIIHVSSGQSINSIVEELKEENSIRSPFALKVFIKLLKSGKGIISGDYLINKNSPVYVVAGQIARGHHNIDRARITFREGLNNEQMAEILESKITSFRKDLFLSKVEDKQGYLFPDTYFLYPLDTTDEIIKKLEDNFKKRTKNIKEEIIKDNKSFSDIIIMASILEGEASGKEDIGIISGILWKRFSMGMRLQVDIDKNTYIEKGLPEKPLNNPGMLSIEASFNPIDSSYLYYLHDKEGVVRYARNFEEHKKNINNYLK